MESNSTVFPAANRPTNPLRARDVARPRIARTARYRPFVALLAAALLLAITATFTTAANAAPPAASGSPGNPSSLAAASSAPRASAAPSAVGSVAPAPSAEAPPSDDELHFRDGPTRITLGHDITLALPDAHRFLGPDEAKKVLVKMGNLHNDGVIGLVVPKADDEDWFAVFDWRDDGHIDDGENIDAPELLKSMSEATEESNPERQQAGFPPIHLDGWQVPPAYDRGAHQLSWALIVRDDKGKSVNLNTRILGRTGYVAIDLVTDPKQLEHYRPAAGELLRATTFDAGHRYQDFVKGTDRMAEYGLIGLITGGAGLGVLKLVKLGLLAKFWKLIVVGLLAMKKAAILVIAAIAAFFKRIYARLRGPTA
jgi:uncharacterized membrane-anchored protein